MVVQIYIREADIEFVEHLANELTTIKKIIKELIFKKLLDLDLGATFTL